MNDKGATLDPHQKIMCPIAILSVPFHVNAFDVIVLPYINHCNEPYELLRYAIPNEAHVSVPKKSLLSLDLDAALHEELGHPSQRFLRLIEDQVLHALHDIGSDVVEVNSSRCTVLVGLLRWYRY